MPDAKHASPRSSGQVSYLNNYGDYHLTSRCLPPLPPPQQLAHPSSPPPPPPPLPPPAPPLPLAHQEHQSTILSPHNPSILKLEKISIKKIDFGELDVNKERELDQFLNENKTTSLTINLKPVQRNTLQDLKSLKRESVPSTTTTSVRVVSNASSKLAQIREPLSYKWEKNSSINKSTSLLSSYSFNVKPSLNLATQPRKSEVDLSDQKIIHSFKVRDNNKTMSKTDSKMSLIGIETNKKPQVNICNSNNSTSDHFSFVNVKELINKFECKM